MSIDHLLTELEGARKKIGWREIVAKIHQVEGLAAQDPRFQPKSRLRQLLAKTTGYSENMLRRMELADRFVSTVAEQPGSELHAFDPTCGTGSFLRTALSMSKVEVAKRTYDIDKSKGLTILRDIIRDDPPLETLKDRYNVVVSDPPYPGARKAAPRDLLSYEKALFSTILDNLEEFVGDREAQAYFKRFTFQFAGPDAVAVGVRSDNYGIEFVDGFEFRRISGDAPKSMFNRAIADLALSSTFFRAYWVAMNEDDREPPEVTVDALNELGLMSVGLFRRKNGNEIEIVRRPTLRPSPDRQDVVKREIAHRALPGV
jgi:hypothetical protein